MEIKDGRLQAHRDIGMAMGRALKITRRNTRRPQHQKVRQAVDEFGHWFVVGVNAADGLAVFVLQRGESAPFVDGKFRGVSLPWKIGKGEGGAKQQTSHICLHAHKLGEEKEPVKRSRLR